MMTKKELWFDMDGTIANFYAVEGWLEYLNKEDVFPYAQAGTLLNFSLFARLLHKLQAEGWRIGIISWTSKCGSEEFNLAVEIKVVRYGTNKYIECGGGILFDDEERNRNAWQDKAYEPSQIMEILKTLLSNTH